MEYPSFCDNPKCLYNTVYTPLTIIVVQQQGLATIERTQHPYIGADGQQYHLCDICSSAVLLVRDKRNTHAYCAY